MNWIQKNYERALLVFSAVLALLGSGWIIFKASSFGSRFMTDEPALREKLEPLSADAITEASRRVSAVPQWPINLDMPLFSSTPFLVMNDKPSEPFRMRDAEGDKLRNPVTNIWLVDNDLDYTAIDVLEQDPDRDGYTNLDEFEAGTDPNSSLSKPGWETKLYYVERVEVPLTIKLNSFDNGTCSVAFITQGADGAEQRRNEFLKIGTPSARFEPGRFTITEVKNETVQRFGSPTQVAVALMTDAKNPRAGKIRLEQGSLVPNPSYTAKFSYTLTAETFETKEGEDFELRQPAGMTITVEEISAEQAVISYVPENASEPVKQVKKLSSPPKGQ